MRERGEHVERLKLPVIVSPSLPFPLDLSLYIFSPTSSESKVQSPFEFVVLVILDGNG